MIMNINTSSSLTTSSAPASNVVAVNVSELQKQAQQQRTQTLEQVKPVAEQVFISQQAQKQLEIYQRSASNAAQQTDVSDTSNQAISSEQAVDTVKMLQKRQTIAAIASYAQQQAQATPPATKPAAEPEQAAEAKSISITA